MYMYISSNALQYKIVPFLQLMFQCVSRHSPMTNPNSLIAEVDKLLAEE